jgi:hypothetical protein
MLLLRIRFVSICALYNQVNNCGRRQSLNQSEQVLGKVDLNPHWACYTFLESTDVDKQINSIDLLLLLQEHFFYLQTS